MSVQPAIHPDMLAEAVTLLRSGRLAAFPTETVYGLGGDARSAEAVAAIYRTKGRPSHNPLIVHVADQAQIEPDVLWPEAARQLADLYWPGPLTLVCRRSPDCRLTPAVSAGGDTVAIRIPAHPIAQMLLRAAGLPIAAPSANRSGAVSPTSAAHVRESLGDTVPLILDGGDCPVGIESTVLDVSREPFCILRHGSITQEELAAVLPEAMLQLTETTPTADEALKSPGLLSSHYAPKAAVRLNVLESLPGETLLAFGETALPARLNLSPTGDLHEAARHLFRYLRQLDAEGVDRIAVMPIPNEGVGLALNDRLRRAAAPRNEALP